jgi:type VI secretion system protein ImpE
MSADIAALLNEARLDEAIAAMNAEVRAHPSDVNRRTNLADLLCVAGNFERADTLIDAVSSIDTSVALGVALYRQLIRAEQARRQFYAEGRVPEFLAKPDGACEIELRASVLMRDGDGAQASALLAQRDESWRPLAGTADGASFDDFRDLDDLNASHLEVLTSTGKYFWVPIGSVASIEFRAPERRRDLIWRRAQLSVAGGPDGEVFIPAIYVAKGSRPEHLLGHTTDFAGGEGAPMTGLGMRSFLVGEEDKTIMELSKIEFAAPVALAA